MPRASQLKARSASLSTARSPLVALIGGLVLAPVHVHVDFSTYFSLSITDRLAPVPKASLSFALQAYDMKLLAFHRLLGLLVMN